MQFEITFERETFFNMNIGNLLRYKALKETSHTSIFILIREDKNQTSKLYPSGAA